MGRVFSKAITREELARKILEASVVQAAASLFNDWPTITDDDRRKPVQAVYRHQYGLGLKTLTPQVEKDLGKVRFDTENQECEPSKAYCGAGPVCGFRTLSNGLTYLGVIAGGDWECPVFYIIYWDGEKLRGYIPTDGNLWNTDTKMAYGNADESGDEESDSKNIKKRFGVDVDEASDFAGDMDPAKIEADILGRIQSTVPAAGKKRFRFTYEVDAASLQEAYDVARDNFGSFDVEEV